MSRGIFKIVEYMSVYQTLGFINSTESKVESVWIFGDKVLFIFLFLGALTYLVSQSEI